MKKLSRAPSYFAEVCAQDLEAGRALLRRTMMRVGGSYVECARAFDVDRRGLDFILERHGLTEEAADLHRRAKAHFRLPPL